MSARLPYQSAFWVCGAIGLLALPALPLILRRSSRNRGITHLVPVAERDSLN